MIRINKAVNVFILMFLLVGVVSGCSTPTPGPWERFIVCDDCGYPQPDITVAGFTVVKDAECPMCGSHNYTLKKGRLVGKHIEFEDGTTWNPPKWMR